MDNRREFLRKAILLSGSTGLINVMPTAIQKAMAINPAPGSTYLDAEHIVILMQENRSFDHSLGTLSGVRGYNDPRAINLPDKKPVWFQTDATGRTYAPFRLNIKNSKSTWTGDLPHSRASQVDAYNEGKYDKWLPAKKSHHAKYSAMPLTLGHYTREDLPFNYALADAFTVCDQNFCSAMTSTTPNRSFFWTGKITNEENGLPKANIRNEDYSYGKHIWKTFPELLEENGISWSFYQNELSANGGFSGEERSWLSNFGCNLLEFFAPYNVKFQKRYIENLQKRVDTLPGQITKLQEESPSSEERAKKVQNDIRNKQKALDEATTQLKKWNQKNFELLAANEKSLHHRAFVSNQGDPNYRSLDKLSYRDNGVNRELSIPKGDLFYQFRKDVENGSLPTISWLAGPQNFSDHPSAPWYGAWYVSQVMDILTQNPEVWKKTIVIVTYDENDGYYDHIPPFSIPDKNKPETGKVSSSIDTEVEHVRIANEEAQGVPKKQAREAPIGLGFRVPMIVASPWSRGGKVCSQVFDHTSTLQFLEHFVNKKFSKNIHLDNISAWRRTICGNLTSVFTPFNKQEKPIEFIDRDAFIQTIFSAKFKEDPGDFKMIDNQQIEQARRSGSYKELMSQQEPGGRPSCALPYQLRAEGSLQKDNGVFSINFAADKDLFGDDAAGSPFTVYAPDSYRDENGKSELCRNWSFAVTAGDELSYQWPLKAFKNESYQLHVHGPNGFYREFSGSPDDPELTVSTRVERKSLTKGATGNLEVTLTNHGSKLINVKLEDLSYKTGALLTKKIPAGGSEKITVNLQKSYGWYDFAITSTEESPYWQRFAGRVETGNESFTDPLIS